MHLKYRDGAVCVVTDCSAPPTRRWMCRVHYVRWKKHGDPLRVDPGGPHCPSLLERFWVQVDKSGDCWLWTGAKSPSGYGQFAVNRQPTRVHRYSWELANGPIPAGLSVLHRCDVRNCLKPEHLWLGTAADNQRDMTEKGRGRVGPRNGHYIDGRAKRRSGKG